MNTVPLRPRRPRRNSKEEVPGLPTTRRGERTRAQLMRAATDAIDATGYQAVRIADITDRIKAPASLFYRYFQSKAHITREIVEQFHRHMVAELDMAGGDTPFARIHAANAILARTYEQHPGLMRIIASFNFDEPEFYALVEGATHAWHRRVAESLARRFPAHGLDEDMLLAMADIAGSMVEQLLYDRFVLKEPELANALPDAEAVARFLSILWHRAMFLTDPPVEEMRGFEEMAQLRF